MVLQSELITFRDFHIKATIIINVTNFKMMKFHLTYNITLQIGLTVKCSFELQVYMQF